MNKVLIIEDQEDLRELITYNLEKENRFDVVAAENANDALIIIEDLKFDIILLDLMLPGLKGLDFLKILKNNPDHTNVAIIIISAKTDEEDIVKGLKMGADDYLPKPFSFKLLITKIDTILRRIQPDQQSELMYRNLLINEQQRKAFIEGQEISLTKKEFELLFLFMKYPKKAFHRNQLLNTVWGYEADVYTRTVDAHISSLRKKLGEQGKYIRSIPKIGYGLDI